ncbi:hypothetical protein E2C01_047059 [Portunus trituberculatus]|uniref:Uncharacterized protein n=1 Tax=Portunus trituberculatus TaxID=210409 RepID=A0A5B7G2L8_PORTR|nr:hypothetical protein [Portunus trituberculatus]
MLIQRRKVKPEAIITITTITLATILATAITITPTITITTATTLPPSLLTALLPSPALPDIDNK